MRSRLRNLQVFVLLAAVIFAMTVQSQTAASAAPLSYPCGTGWPGVYGAIADRYYQPNIRAGLGCPVNWEYDASSPNRAQNFQGGLIYWYSTGYTGATWGDIYMKWANQCGGIWGVLGPPEPGDEEFEYVSGGIVYRLSKFLFGSIVWKSSDGSTVASNGNQHVVC